MENNTVTVPYEDFVSLVCAKNDFDNFKKLVAEDVLYVGKDTKVFLGIKEKTNV